MKTAEEIRELNRTLEDYLQEQNDENTVEFLTEEIYRKVSNNPYMKDYFITIKIEDLGYSVKDKLTELGFTCTEIHGIQGNGKDYFIATKIKW